MEVLGRGRRREDDDDNNNVLPQRNNYSLFLVQSQGVPLLEPRYVEQKSGNDIHD